VRYTFAQAEAFYWTARLTGFRAAAAHLHLAQPTVSLRVRELERILGGALFDRSGYRPGLTPLGRAIYDDVERMLSLADRIMQNARDPAPKRGLMRIGAADSFAGRVLPGLLKVLAERHPELQINVTVDFSTRLEALLFERQVDVCFLSDPRPHEQMRLAPLWPISLVWLVGPELGLDGETVTPEDLVDLPIFTNASPSHLYRTIQHWFGQRGLVPRRLNTCNPLYVIGRLASAGTGAALLPLEMIDDCPELKHLRVLRPDPPLPQHEFHAMWWAEDGTDDRHFLADLAREIGSAGAR
jgi:DNA-binding transcriptional LysR family regulator